MCDSWENAKTYKTVGSEDQDGEHAGLNHSILTRFQKTHHCGLFEKSVVACRGAGIVQFVPASFVVMLPQCYCNARLMKIMPCSNSGRCHDDMWNMC